MLLLYILIKILFKNFVYKLGEARGGGEAPAQPPNRNASNDKFATKTAILSSVSFSWFVFTLTRDRKDLFVFFLALHLFLENNSALQTVTPVPAVFLFWSSLYKLWFGSTPNPKLVSNKISPPPPPTNQNSLSRTVKTFFLGVHRCDLWFGPPPIKNPG